MKTLIKKLYSSFLILIVLLSNQTFSKTPIIKTFEVQARGGESLKELLSDYVGVPEETLYKKKYLSKIKKWNPSIANFNSLRAGELVYVELPYKTILTPIKFQKSFKTQRKDELFVERAKSTNEKKLDFTAKEKKRKLNFSLFYALSKGSLDEIVPDNGANVESTQNSPITLGLAAFRPINNNWNYSGSVYFSKLTAGVVNIGDEDRSISIPLEYGFTSYLGFKKSLPFELYGGVDYEHFSSLNIDEFIIGETLSTREHSLGFLTLGASKRLAFGTKVLLLKGSMSMSVFSSQSRESLVNPKAFSGSKLILYANLKPHKKWFYHALYKQHNLSGATELKVSRLGIGLGYIF